MTLKEYLMDYASEDTRKKGEAVIEAELERITNPKVKETAREWLTKIEQGERDFRF